MSAGGFAGVKRCSAWKRVVGFLLAGIIGGVLFFPRAGDFLVVEDPFSHAEIALVLSGDPVSRPLEARDLYRQGRVERILVIPEPPNPNEKELVALGLQEPNLPQTSERILAASGVPLARIQFLPEPAEGTITEAVRVKKFLRTRNLLNSKEHSELAVITSRLSSRRSRFVFRWVFNGENAKIFSAPTSYDQSQLHRWWVKPRNAFYVAMEYQKFFWNILTLLLGLYEE